LLSLPHHGFEAVSLGQYDRELFGQDPSDVFNPGWREVTTAWGLETVISGALIDSVASVILIPPRVAVLEL
jgi:hypothetical protein